MQITLFSFLSAVLWSSVLIIAIYFLRKSKHYKHYFGVLSIVLLYLFCAARVFLPIELPHTYVIGNDTIYPQIYKLLVNENAVVGGISLYQILIAIWVSVFIVLMVRYIGNYYKALKSIKQYAVPYGEDEDRILGEVKSLARKDIKVSVFMTGNISVPFGFGLFRKKILLPFGNYPEDELRYILLHEYTHFINRDIPVKLLISFFCMIFWWNPVVYLLKKDLEQTLEIKCDLALAKHLNPQERAAYLWTIINTLKRDCAQTMPPCAATAFFNYNSAAETKERFAAVMNCDKGKYHVVTNALFMCIFIFLLHFSYSVVPQPTFDAPQSTESGAIDFDSSSSYIRQDKSGNYWLCVATLEPFSISESDAEFYQNTGVKIFKE